MRYSPAARTLGIVVVYLSVLRTSVLPQTPLPTVPDFKPVSAILYETG